MSRFEKLEQHPNPIFFRNNFLSLDGTWQFEFDNSDQGLKENWQMKEKFSRTINVPFVFQSEQSGINSQEFCSTVWYKRQIKIPADMNDKRIRLHFGAVDYHTTVWVNGQLIGTHTGGYSSFEMDITPSIVLNKDNDITIRVYDDDYCKHQIRGKQLWAEKPFGCWYTRYTGIWQSVWLEFVNELHIQQFIVTPLLDTKEINIKAVIEGLDALNKDVTLQAEVFYEDKSIAQACVRVENTYPTITFSIDNKQFEFEGVAIWSPARPSLYGLTLRLCNQDNIFDEVESYFGMRKLETKCGKVLLNNFPYYQKLILNQGYYPKGLITAEDDERICQDIQLIKSLGYNGMRIHQKIESARFLYWCDVYGIIVWEEIPSMYSFEGTNVHQILGEMLEIIKRDINHPCIFTWVLFNESWGINKIKGNTYQQNLTLAAYHAVKALDQTRFVISNDGWEHTKSDLCTLHDYSAVGEQIEDLHSEQDMTITGNNFWAQQRRLAFADGFTYEGQPILLSEYGGISFSSDSGWGYNGKVDNEDAFFNRFQGLMDAIRRMKHIQGYCYTQFTDVEHEQNGLLTIDRTPKVNVERVAKINL